ncbi:M48 family metallopeptidase [Cereibacter azotoformans]|uniref:M48 family metallopeptidase n=1 Tax=Cereibacter azotoformans TaxID=43057 RepID=UPI001EEBA590|nr:SprT family zinc-dependent metalloprotease [Cereibacter azotoformans]ULB11850.1 M48 family metallopeptidase [Cereibacter azotoformans]
MIEVAGLSVELVRKPIKNLHVGVYPPAGRVRVAAPPAVSEDAVRLAIVTRLGWIKKKQREFAGQARETERRCVSGETHYFLGKPLRLSVRFTGTRGCKISMGGSDRLVMTVAEDATSEDRMRCLAAWYRNQLKLRVAPRVGSWSERLDVQVPQWGVRQMRTKWGSCNPDKHLIWVNLELAKKPLQCLDYVILHEMAHFLSRRHNDLFIATLDRHMPGWRQVRADLNALPLMADAG